MFTKRFTTVAQRFSHQFRTFGAPVIAGEPLAPKIVCNFPGPKNEEAIKNLGDVTCNLTQGFGFFTDIKKSKGSFVADIDGNLYLDLFQNIASTAMGHNNPDVLEFCRSERMVEVVANRTAQGFHPRGDQQDILQEAFMDVAPKGLNMVAPAMCGSCAVESAWKYAIINYAQNQRGGVEVPPSEEDMNSCMSNSLPGAKNDYVIMSFMGSFHGRMFGSLSASRTKPIQKVDMPMFDWPAVEPPRYKYPLDENVEYNRKQDDDSLKGITDTIDHWKQEKGKEVVCIALEPIMCEGGDLQISGYFANGVRKLTKERGIFMMVDEVQTGVVCSGTYWAHEQWNLDSPPDFMTFAKKMQASGFYYNSVHKMTMPMRHHNTWLGDPVRALLALNQNKLIKRDNLMENAITTAAQLRQGLLEISSDYPQWVQDVRGMGTCLAFNTETEAMRPTLLSALKANGVYQNVCGPTGIRLRPNLYFTERHATMYLDILRNTVKSL